MSNFCPLTHIDVDTHCKLNLGSHFEQGGHKQNLSILIKCNNKNEKKLAKAEKKKKFCI